MISYFAQNLTARCLVLTFGAWRDQARNTKRLERIKDRVIRAWRAGSLRPAFYSLVANAERQTRVRKTLNRMRLMFIGRVLLEWRDLVAELLDLRASERRKVSSNLKEILSVGALVQAYRFQIRIHVPRNILFFVIQLHDQGSHFLIYISSEILYLTKYTVTSVSTVGRRLGEG